MTIEILDTETGEITTSRLLTDDEIDELLRPQNDDDE